MIAVIIYFYVSRVKFTVRSGKALDYGRIVPLL